MPHKITLFSYPNVDSKDSPFTKHVLMGIFGGYLFEKFT